MWAEHLLGKWQNSRYDLGHVPRERELFKRSAILHDLARALEVHRRCIFR